jgi:hypothetical protein
MPPYYQPEPEKHSSLTRKIASSPILYTGVGYIAVFFALLVYEFVLKGRLTQNSNIVYASAAVLTPTIVICPLLGAALAILYLRRRHRLEESIVSLVTGAPVLLLLILMGLMELEKLLSRIGL